MSEAKAKYLAAKAAFEETFEKHLQNGVEFISDQVFIDPEVEIAPGAVILPGCILRGKTVIGANCVIGPNTLLENTIVEAGSTVNASQCYDSHLGPNNKIGPFTHVRTGTVTDEGVHLGAYVETKNANFAEGNTVSHLTYIGDADVGKYCNFGCGTVTCNYDGEGKYRTTIGDYAFIGCNTNLVAPVKVGSRAFTAAGSTIGHDVPDGALGIERAKQAEVAAWGAKKLEKYVAKKQKLEAEKKNDLCPLTCCKEDCCHGHFGTHPDRGFYHHPDRAGRCCKTKCFGHAGRFQ